MKIKVLESMGAQAVNDQATVKCTPTVKLAEGLISFPS